MADQSGTPIKSDTSSTATLLLTWSSLGLVVERSLHVCAGWYVCRFPLALALALGMLASILTLTCDHMTCDPLIRSELV